MSIPGGTEPLILGIDPDDANTVYLRVTNGGLSDSVVITTSGGQSFDTALTITGQFSSFLRAGDGNLYLGTLAGTLYVRAPGASTFTNHPGPHFRCLGQRPGTSRIFACGDMGVDGFSVGYSDDSGQTFHRMMSFVDLLGPLTCAPVQSNCESHWAAESRGCSASVRCRMPDPAGADRTPAPLPMPGRRSRRRTPDSRSPAAPPPVATARRSSVCSWRFSSGG